MSRRTLFFIFLAAIVGGCATLDRNKQLSELDPTLSAFTGAIRWGNIESATGFSRPRDGRDPNANPATLAGLKVIGYTVRVNRINETADEANVSISFTYYHEDRGSILQADQTAIWYYSDTDKSWYLDDVLPDFKR